MKEYFLEEHEFDPNDKEMILLALKDPDPKNPIAIAVAERLKELTGLYAQHAERLGRIPTELMLVEPETALDDIVYHLHLQMLADELGHHVTVVWVPRHDDKQKSSEAGDK